MSSTCNTCPAWVAPAEMKPEADAAARSHGVDRRGTCQRFPQSVRKDPTDWCGEHPERRKAERTRS